MLHGIMRARGQGEGPRAVSMVQLAFGEVAGQRRVAVGQEVPGEYGARRHFLVSIHEERAVVEEGRTRVGIFEVDTWYFPLTYEAWLLEALDSSPITYLPFDWVHRHASEPGDVEQGLFHLLVRVGYANRSTAKPADDVLRALGRDAVQWALLQRSTESSARSARDREARFAIEKQRPLEIAYTLTGAALAAAVEAFMEVPRARDT